MDLLVITMAAENATVYPTAYSGLNTVQVASLLIGVFIPILVGLVTKRTTNTAVKSILLLALSCTSGFLTEYVNSNNFIWQQALLTSVITFVIGVATHYGLWTPTGVTAKAQDALVHDKGDGGYMYTEYAITGAVLLALAFCLSLGLALLLA
jgi:hypothetical protein